jgi:hypothetical protein
VAVLQSTKLGKQALVCLALQNLHIKGILAARIDCLLLTLNVANIRCSILKKCSEQKARFKKYLVRMTFKIENT